MKIKTLTTYDVYNYGASLQAYALQRYLTMQGHDVEIIRYQPDYLSRKYDYKWVNPESRMSRYILTRVVYRTLKFLQRQTTIGRKRQFDYFNHQILVETNKLYKTYEDLRDNPPEADLFIVGSDQIWNVFYDAGRDPAFYLDFVRKGLKASYAASFSYLNIDEGNKIRISKSLQTFDAVSVREFHGLEILKDMGVEGEWVMDPVFLLSIDEWKKLMTNFVKTEPYMLIYDFEGNEALKSFAKDYAKKHGLKLYAIVDTYPLSYVHRNFKKAGPQDFITLIYNCDAFISNSFHGTAFSILFEKPVFVFNRHRHKVNSRMESLLNLFGLGDCLIDDDESAEKALEYVFNYQSIGSTLAAERRKSIKFLDKILSND